MPKFNSSWVERNIFYIKTEGEHAQKPCPHYKQHERPLIVCLIGSTRFKKDHEEVQRQLGRERKIGIPVSCYDFSGVQKGDSLEIKKALDELHFHKIDLADEVYVVNPVVPVCPFCYRPVIYNPKWGGHDCKECNIRGEYIERPYIGESTKRELSYSIKLGKTIHYLTPPIPTTCPDCKGNGFPSGIRVGDSPRQKCSGTGYLLDSAAIV